MKSKKKCHCTTTKISKIQAQLDNNSNMNNPNNFRYYLVRDIEIPIGIKMKK